MTVKRQPYRVIESIEDGEEMKRALAKKLTTIHCLVAMLWAVAAQAVTPTINSAIKNIDNQIPEIQKVPIDVERPKVDIKLPEEAIEDTKARLEELNKVAVESVDPLQTLAQNLTIKNKQGETILIEKEVEDGWRAVANQWLLMLDNQDIDQLEKVNAVIIKKTKLKNLEMTLVQFEVPSELDSLSALQIHLPAEWMQQLGRNHIYEANGETDSDQEAVKEEGGLKIQNAVCNKKVRIGLIDTGIEEGHLAFSKASVQSKNFMDQELTLPTAHGTAVAGLLIGKQGQLVPLLPNATLYAASVFYPRNEYSQGAVLINLVQALDWMIANRVVVINMSLTGPDNPVLAQAIAKAKAKGAIIIAAVGNEGPAARPLFPAAYSDVIGATAVDKNEQVYRWANQGDYIDFSALGVSVLTARANNQLGRESGTSIAAPVVSAFAACYANGSTQKEEVVARLNKRVKDLGRPGKDRVFGYGLLHP